MTSNKISLNPDKSKYDIKIGYPVDCLDENNCVGTLEEAIKGTTEREFFCVEFPYEQKAEILKYMASADIASRSDMIEIKDLAKESGYTETQIKDKKFNTGLVNGKNWSKTLWKKMSSVYLEVI